MVVDAYVEIRHPGRPAWYRTHDWRSSLASVTSFLGPWSVPHATEIARGIFRLTCNSGHGVRVIDTAGVVVEEWPKR